jgi:hypothetical protein
MLQIYMLQCAFLPGSKPTSCRLALLPEVLMFATYDVAVHFFVTFAITAPPLALNQRSTHALSSRLSKHHLLCNATTLIMKPTLNTNTTTGSTFKPGESSVYSFNIVLEEPPAPAARVLAGRWLAVLSL